MKNLKISRKILISFAIVIAAAIILGVASLVMVGAVGNVANTYASETIPSVYSLWIARRAILTLFSKEQGEMLVRAAEAENTSARVHVKAETGLYRLGFSGPDAVQEIYDLAATDRLRMEGLFTHLALHTPASDAKQLEIFLGLRDALAERGIHFQLVHAADSIGMVRYPQYRLDAVRAGAWLYGVKPDSYPQAEHCQLVASFKARVSQLHNVAKGELIGYDDHHPLTRDSVIATLSAGYVDGVPRLNNVGEVLVRGKRAKVVGLVCMDQMMVDVTDIPGVTAGDEVTFLGDGIGVKEYSEWGKLNRNESLARFGKRVTRVYSYRGKEFYSNDLQG